MIAAGLVLPLLLSQVQGPAPGADAKAAAATEGAGASRSRRPRARQTAALGSATFPDDPPIAVLRAAATALALAEPERARSFLLRARLAGWLPEIRVRLDRRLARTESLDLSPSAADPGGVNPVGVDSINEMRYEWRATWDLGRLVFSPDELGASAQALRLAEVRRETESLVIRLYFERRRLKAEAMASDALDTAPEARDDLRVQEIEAELDALTGGAFSRWKNPRAGGASGATP
jgi:hypothetical protein